MHALTTRLETCFDELVQPTQPFTLNFTPASSSSKQLRSSSSFLQGRPTPPVLCGNSLAFFQVMNGVDQERQFCSAFKHPNQ